MRLLVFAAAVVVTVADTHFTYEAPQIYQPPLAYVAPAPSTRSESFGNNKLVPILRDDRFHSEEGAYSYDVETGDGIFLSQSGSPSGPQGAMIKAGHYSYTAPDGTLVEVKYVADENGFQPESPLLPVAPEFPHPIPKFVLEQIAFAAEEDAARARDEASQVRSASVPAPSHSYVTPQ